MNFFRVSFILLTAGMAIMLGQPARAADPSCAAHCESEESACTTRLGPKSQGNCMDGFRVCVQRCNPHTLNATYLDGFAERRALYRVSRASEAGSCSQNCVVAGRNCAEAGNSHKQCQAAQTSCVARCPTS